MTRKRFNDKTYTTKQAAIDPAHRAPWSGAMTMYNRSDILYFPIRKNADGKEFTLLTEWGANAEHAQAKADDCRRESFDYDCANPVQRIARIEMTMEEIES